MRRNLTTATSSFGFGSCHIWTEGWTANLKCQQGCTRSDNPIKMHVAVRKCVKSRGPVRMPHQQPLISQRSLCRRRWSCDVLALHLKNWSAGERRDAGNDLRGAQQKQSESKLRERRMHKCYDGRGGDVPAVESKNSCSLPGVPSSSSYSCACRIISSWSNSFTSRASALLWFSYSCRKDKASQF